MSKEKVEIGKEYTYSEDGAVFMCYERDYVGDLLMVSSNSSPGSSELPSVDAGIRGRAYKDGYRHYTWCFSHSPSSQWTLSNRSTQFNKGDEVIFGDDSYYYYGVCSDGDDLLVTNDKEVREKWNLADSREHDVCKDALIAGWVYGYWPENRSSFKKLPAKEVIEVKRPYKRQNEHIHFRVKAKAIFS